MNKRKQMIAITAVVATILIIGMALPLREVISGYIPTVPLAYFYMFVMIFVVAMSSAFLLYFSRSVIDPIERITKTIEEMSTGNLEVEIDPRLRESGDEIGALARAFERTVTSLKLAMKMTTPELRRANEMLQLEVEERRKTEEQLRLMNRMYSVVSGINQSVVRIHDRRRLFDEVCQIFVEKGLFRFAWIGLADENGSVNMVSSFGADGGYLKEVKVCLGGKKAVDPVGEALRAGKHFLCNNVDECEFSFRDATLKYGYMSFAAFPIRIGKRVIGVIGAYSGEEDFFDEQELRLLIEAAQDLSFAIKIMELEEKKRPAGSASRVPERHSKHAGATGERKNLREKG